MNKANQNNTHTTFLLKYDASACPFLYLSLQCGISVRNTTRGSILLKHKLL